MDKNTSNDEKVPVKCPICKGTGFRYGGVFCACITDKNFGKVPNSPDGWPDIFKNLFGGRNARNN